MMVENMRHHGIDVFATINNQPYADYFSPYVFLSYLTSLGGRWINMFSLALPTILLAAYTTAITYKIGAKIKPEMGAYAVIFTFLAYEYLNICRQFSIDMPVAAATVTIIYSLGENRWKAMLLIPLSFFFAYAMRGPFGLIMSGGALGGWLLMRREWKNFILWAATGAICSGICVLATVFLIFYSGGRELWDIFVEWQISSRMKDGKELYFFTNAVGSFAITYPVTVAVFAFNYKKLAFWRESNDQAVMFLRGIFGWIILPLIALSIPGCKHLRYMTAVIPALCLGAAFGALQLQNSVLHPVIIKIMKQIERLVLPLLAVFIVVFHLITKQLVSDGGSLLMAPLIAVGVLFCIRHKTKKFLPHPLFKLCCAVAAVTLTVNILVVAPWYAKYENSSRFVAAVEQQRRGEVYLYQLGPDHDDLKYLIHLSPERRIGVKYIFDKGAGSKMYPVAGNAALLAELPSGDIVIMRERDIKKIMKLIPGFDELFEEIVSGKMAHRTFVAFVKNIPPMLLSLNLKKAFETINS